jgi:ATP-dependent Lhr-like helicase
VQRNVDAADGELLAISDGLSLTAKVAAIADRHDVQGLPGCEHRAMPGPCMIGMTMRDNRLFDRTDRIDMGFRLRAIEAFGGEGQELAHERDYRPRILKDQRPRNFMRHSLKRSIWTQRFFLTDFRTGFHPAAGARAHTSCNWSNICARGQSTLLIAPTGAGKTLAGFLPSLVELEDRGKRKPGQAGGIHTLYISPLKALAVDIARNLEAPVSEMGLPFRIETRTGDTPSHKRQRQKTNPPDILLTTPEQIALLLSDPASEKLFSSLRTVILDELHALVTSKRGDLLALGLARLRQLAPEMRTIGLSATVAEPDDLRAYLVGQPLDGTRALSSLVEVKGGAEPDISILESEERLPWSGHSCRYAIGDIYQQIKQHNVSLLFVNTRSQAEAVFQELWRINDDTLPIALHHGSLDVGQRRKVEAAMASGQLRAVVATSSLDMGIDWGDIDLVINIGAPKGASRLAQRIGRANHRMDEPSKAVLVPANRFEVLECQAALGGFQKRRSGHATASKRRARCDGPAPAWIGLRRSS